MNTSIRDLSLLRQSQLKATINNIVSLLHPEKIILFGISELTRLVELTGLPMPLGLDAFDMLVVTRRNGRLFDHEIQDKIEGTNNKMLPSVNLLAHDIDHVNTRRQEGHYFFSMLDNEAILVYDAGRVPLAVAAAPDLVRIRSVALADQGKWGQRALAFYNSALFNLQGGNKRLTMFMLHQTAEQIYQAVLLVFMGYKPCTHNLDKLRRFTQRLSLELAMLFPRHTETEDRLFKQLMHAYVDARYKDEFDVTNEDLAILVDRVARLLEIAERVCRNRLISLEKMVGGGWEESGRQPGETGELS